MRFVSAVAHDFVKKKARLSKIGLGRPLENFPKIQIPLCTLSRGPELLCKIERNR